MAVTRPESLSTSATRSSERIAVSPAFTGVLGVTTVAPQSVVIKTAAPGSACVVLPACVAGAELFPPHAASVQTNSSAAKDRRSTFPPSARGTDLKADGRSSDSGLPLAPPSRLAASGTRAESVSPYSGGTVPESHRLPFPLALCVAGGYQAAVKGSPNASRRAASTSVRVATTKRTGRSISPRTASRAASSDGSAITTQTAVPSSLYGSARYRRAEDSERRSSASWSRSCLPRSTNSSPSCRATIWASSRSSTSSSSTSTSPSRRPLARAAASAASSCTEERSPARTMSSQSGRSRSWLWAAYAMTLVEEPARWIGWNATSGYPPVGALRSVRGRNPHQPLDPGHSLGCSHLHALLGAGSRHGPRHLGLRPAEDRAHGGVRTARRAPLPCHSPRARRASRRLRLRGYRRVPPDFRLGAPRLAHRLAHRHGRRHHRRRHRGPPMALSPVAIDLDGALGDTRPLWHDFLVDAARRYASIAPLDPSTLPEDRGAAAQELDRWAEQGVGDWRGALERFAEDRAPVHFPPSAPLPPGRRCRAGPPRPGRDGRASGLLQGRARRTGRCRAGPPRRRPPRRAR